MNIYTNNIIEKEVKKLSLKDEFRKDFYYQYLYIISYVRTQPYMDKRFEFEDFVPVSINVLREVLSYNNAHKLLRNLVDENILICDNFYISGLKSKGYRLNDDLKKAKFYVLNKDDIKDKGLVKKLATLEKVKRDKVYEKSFGYIYVTEYMDKLKINNQNCFDYINENIQEIKRRDCYTMMVDIFHDKFSTVDETGNRLHNNLTNLATPLRQYITYNEQPLTEVDIKNSQPLFLYLMMRDYHIPKEEMEKYKKAVCVDGFYEFFADKMGVNLTKENRKEFKQDIFSGVLFDRNRKKLSVYEEAFKKEFPIIFYVVRSIKEKQYKDVAINLQKTESKFIFYVVEKIAKEYKIPLFTIHDSICTTNGKENIIKKVMQEEFEKLYSINPILNVNSFG